MIHCIFIRTIKRLFNFRFHYTYSTNALAAVHEALAQLCEEGLESCWERHTLCAKMFHEGLQKLDLQTLVKKEENRFDAVTPFFLPKDVPAMPFLEYIRKK